MSTTVLKKIVGSKVGQVVLGSIVVGVAGTVGAVMGKKWVVKKLTARELRRVEAAAQKELQRVAAEAEKESQRLAAIAEQERQRAAALAEKASQRAAALAEKATQRAAALAAKAQLKAEQRASRESRVGVALNRTFQRLGLNLRAEVNPGPGAPDPKAK